MCKSVRITIRKGLVEKVLTKVKYKVVLDSFLTQLLHNRLISRYSLSSNVSSLR